MPAFPFACFRSLSSGSPSARSYLASPSSFIVEGGTFEGFTFSGAPFSAAGPAVTGLAASRESPGRTPTACTSASVIACLAHASTCVFAAVAPMPTLLRMSLSWVMTSESICFLVAISFSFR